MCLNCINRKDIEAQIDFNNKMIRAFKDGLKYENLDLHEVKSYMRLIRYYEKANRLITELLQLNDYWGYNE